MIVFSNHAAAANNKLSNLEFVPTIRCKQHPRSNWNVATLQCLRCEELLENHKRRIIKRNNKS